MINNQLACAIWPRGVETKDQMARAEKDIKEVGYKYFESIKSVVGLFKDNQNEFGELTKEPLELDTTRITNKTSAANNMKYMFV